MSPCATCPVCNKAVHAAEEQLTATCTTCGRRAMHLGCAVKHAGRFINRCCNSYAAEKKRTQAIKHTRRFYEEEYVACPAPQCKGNLHGPDHVNKPEKKRVSKPKSAPPATPKLRPVSRQGPPGLPARRSWVDRRAEEEARRATEEAALALAKTPAQASGGDLEWLARVHSQRQSAASSDSSGASDSSAAGATAPTAASWLAELEARRAAEAARAAKAVADSEAAVRAYEAGYRAGYEAGLAAGRAGDQCELHTYFSLLGAV